MVTRKTSKDTRDELDHAIAHVVKNARLPRNLPRPGRHEPADEELLRFMDGTASPAERRRVEEAMERSAYTRDRVRLLREAMTESGHDSLAQRAIRFVFVKAQGALEFLRGSSVPLAAPAAAVATRGAVRQPPKSSYWEFATFVGKLQASLRVEHVGPARIDVQVSLAEGRARVQDARITLTRAGRVVDSIPLEHSGTATFSGLDLASYELEIKKAGQPPATLHLDILD